MKRTFLSTIVALASVVAFSIPVDYKIIGMENFASELAVEYIEKNLPDTLHTYFFELLQEEDQFTITYSVQPGNIQGSEHTDNIWENMQETIGKALDEIFAQAGYLYYTEPSNKQRTKPIKEKDKKNRKHSYPAEQSNNQTFADYNIKEYLSIGSLYVFPDGSQGIVFYLNKDGRGLVVSLDQAELKWQDEEKAKYCKDISQIPNEKEISPYFTIGEGERYTTAIIEQVGYGAQAAQWCVSHGEGWYLPSVNEMLQLLTIANEKQGGAGIISLALKVAGGTPLLINWYWTSSEENAENAHCLTALGSKAACPKNRKNIVRAVRAF